MTNTGTYLWPITIPPSPAPVIPREVNPVPFNESMLKDAEMPLFKAKLSADPAPLRGTRLNRESVRKIETCHRSDKRTWMPPNDTFCRDGESLLYRLNDLKAKFSPFPSEVARLTDVEATPVDWIIKGNNKVDKISRCLSGDWRAQPTPRGVALVRGSSPLLVDIPCLQKSQQTDAECTNGCQGPFVSNVIDASWHAAKHYQKLTSLPNGTEDCRGGWGVCSTETAHVFAGEDAQIKVAKGKKFSLTNFLKNRLIRLDVREPVGYLIERCFRGLGRYLKSRDKVGPSIWTTYRFQGDNTLNRECIADNFGQLLTLQESPDCRAPFRDHAPTLLNRLTDTTQGQIRTKDGLTFYARGFVADSDRGPDVPDFNAHWLSSTLAKLSVFGKWKDLFNKCISGVGCKKNLINLAAPDWITTAFGGFHKLDLDCVRSRLKEILKIESTTAEAETTPAGPSNTTKAKLAGTTGRPSMLSNAEAETTPAGPSNTTEAKLAGTTGRPSMLSNPNVAAQPSTWTLITLLLPGLFLGGLVAGVLRFFGWRNPYYTPLRR